MSLRDDIIKEIEKYRNKNGKLGSSIASVIASLAPLLAFRSLPLTVICFIISFAAKTIMGKEDLDKKAVPDYLLKEITESDEVSEQGIQFLFKKLKANGFVSVANALEFLEIEQEDAKRKGEVSENTVVTEGEISRSLGEMEHRRLGGYYEGRGEKAKTGAEALLERGEKEHKSFIDVDGISDGFDKICKSFHVEENVESAKRFVKDFFKKL